MQNSNSLVVNAKHRWMHATTKVPRFDLHADGKNFDDHDAPLGVRQSPYFWWYRFLKLNDEYQRALNGETTSIPTEILMDLGNVRETNFYDWWYDRFGNLCGEPQTDIVMKIIKSPADMVPFDSDDAVMLVVPKKWTNRLLKQRFGQIIYPISPPDVRADRLKTSKARYRLRKKWSIKAFEYAHRIYLEKQKADLERIHGSGKKSCWADIAIRARLPMADGLNHEKIGDSEQRRVLTILATRHYNRALKFIKASASFSFPD